MASGCRRTTIPARTSQPQVLCTSPARRKLCLQVSVPHQRTRQIRCLGEFAGLESCTMHACASQRLIARSVVYRDVLPPGRHTRDVGAMWRPQRGDLSLAVVQVGKRTQLDAVRNLCDRPQTLHTAVQTLLAVECVICRCQVNLGPAGVQIGTVHRHRSQ